MDERPNARRRAQLERNVASVCRTVAGWEQHEDTRFSDLVDQIDELRQELKRVAERQDKIAEFIKSNAKLIQAQE